MKHLVAVILAVCFSVPLTAQQAPNQPIEFPEFIVTGKERVEVPGGTKNVPARPPILGKAQLDSLNSLEKVAPPMLPAAALPMPQRAMVTLPGYLSGEIGQYTTPDVKAGYSVVTGGYRLDFAGAMEASNGHVTNAAYHKGEARVLSTYVAPEKFLFFGGSTTELDLGLTSRAYRFFGDTAAAERTVLALRGGVDVEGEFDGVLYRALANYRSTATTLAQRDASDTEIHGAIFGEQRWKDLDVGAGVNIFLRTFAGNAYPFLEGMANGRYDLGSVRLSAQAGLQSATSTKGIVRGGILLQATAQYEAGPDWSIVANLRSGLQPTVFNELLQRNPYVSDTVVLDAAYDIVDVSAKVIWHPTLRVQASAGLRVQQTDRQPVWIPASSGAFTLDYRTANTIELPFEIRWLPTGSDVLRADLLLTSATIVDAKATPYVSTTVASAWYDRVWTQNLRSSLGLVFVGSRFSDIKNERALSGYVDLRAKVEYDVHNRVSVTARVNNLLGADILLWDGYRERGIFVAAGCTWRF